MQNLRDKLLKAGMVSQEAASQAEAEASKPKPRPPPPDRAQRPERAQRPPPQRTSRPAPHASRPRPSAPVRETFIPKLPPLPGSKEYQRIESMKQREIDKQLRELVFEHQVPPERGSHTFYFVTRKGRLRRMEISDTQAQMLEQGKLAVVERQDPDKIEHALVPPEVAEKMYALFPKAVRFLNKEGAAVGFISEEELKTRQDAEKAHEAQEAQEAPARAEGETWIAVKRAEPPTEEG